MAGGVLLQVLLEVSGEDDGGDDAFRRDGGRDGAWFPLAPVGKFKLETCPDAAKPLLTSPKRAPATGEASVARFSGLPFHESHKPSQDAPSAGKEASL